MTQWVEVEVVYNMASYVQRLAACQYPGCQHPPKATGSNQQCGKEDERNPQAEDGGDAGQLRWPVVRNAIEYDKRGSAVNLDLILVLYRWRPGNVE